MKSKNIGRLLIGTAAILMIPLVAMQFSDEVNWGLMDFVIIGILLIGAGLVYELIAKKVSAKHRLIVAAIVAVLVILIWAELAVGLFGSPFAGS
jgi:hypothetical protein